MGKSKVYKLLQYIFAALVLIAAVEYFKYSTMVHYEWFHCTPQYEPVSDAGSLAKKLFAVGGPSCDKRGEFKTLVKRITRDYDVNTNRVSFCIVENTDVAYRHYPVENGNKGDPGYVAYIAEDNDLQGLSEIKDLCKGSAIYHI